jgi:hypothetical protein
MPKAKKNEIMIIAVLFLGLLTLFFFPEPQTNFAYYAATALFFAVIIAFLIKKNK